MQSRGLGAQRATFHRPAVFKKISGPGLLVEYEFLDNARQPDRSP